jgi:hypothetical protein
MISAMCPSTSSTVPSVPGFAGRKTPGLVGDWISRATSGVVIALSVSLTSLAFSAIWPPAPRVRPRRRRCCHQSRLSIGYTARGMFHSPGFQQTGAIADVLVNRDTTQYSGSTDTYDKQLLLFLINNLLLGERHPLPIPSGVPADIATGLYHHHVAGAGHKEPKTLELKDFWRWLWDWLWWLVKLR